MLYAFLVTTSSNEPKSHRCNDRLRRVKRSNHLDAFSPPRNDIGRLLEQFVQDIGLVQVFKQFSLEVLLGEVDECEGDCFRDHVDHFSLDHGEVGSDEEFFSSAMSSQDDLLMTSVSMVSRSFDVATGLITVGGASICPPFRFGCLSFAKKLLKKLGSSFFTSASRSRPLLSVPAGSFPVFGSIGFSGGLLAFIRSETIAIALWPFRKSGCVVLT